MKIVDIILGKRLISEQDNRLLNSLSTLREITMTTANAVPIEWSGDKARFTVGDTDYEADFEEWPEFMVSASEYFGVKMKGGEIFTFGFNVQSDERTLRNALPKGGTANLVKIYSTLYKVLVEFVNKYQPAYLVLSSLEASGYSTIYNTLTKSNKLPGYTRYRVVDRPFNGHGAQHIILRRIGVR